MSVLSRSFALGVSGLAVVVVAGCAGGVGGSEGEDPSALKEPGAALAGVDPCSVMKPDQLTAAGYETQGKPVKQFDFEPGCRYKGEQMILTLYKNQRETVESYGKRSTWAEYSRFDVNGREAARALSKSEQRDGGACTTMLSAGGGVIVLNGIGEDRTGFDTCGELSRVAEQIAPDLPK